MSAPNDHGKRRAAWLGLALIGAAALAELALLVWVAGQVARALTPFMDAQP